MTISGKPCGALPLLGRVNWIYLHEIWNFARLLHAELSCFRQPEWKDIPHPWSSSCRFVRSWGRHENMGSCIGMLLAQVIWRCCLASLAFNWSSFMWKLDISGVICNSEQLHQVMKWCAAMILVHWSLNAVSMGSCIWLKLCCRRAAWPTGNELGQRAPIAPVRQGMLLWSCVGVASGLLRFTWWIKCRTPRHQWLKICSWFSVCERPHENLLRTACRICVKQRTYGWRCWDWNH